MPRSFAALVDEIGIFYTIDISIKKQTYVPPGRDLCPG
jgi:hypothetical protein